MQNPITWVVLHEKPETSPKKENKEKIGTPEKQTSYKPNCENNFLEFVKQKTRPLLPDRCSE